MSWKKTIEILSRKLKGSASVQRDYVGPADDALALVRRLVGKPLITRKSDQSVNIAVIVPTLGLIIGIIWGYAKIATAANDYQLNRASKYQQTREAIYANVVPQALPTLYGSGATVTPQPTATATDTPQPTATPLLMPTWTLEGFVPTVAAAEGQVLEFTYSWYYPDLVGPSDFDENGNCLNVSGDVCHTVNCWNYNTDLKECVSDTASGQPWRPWLGKGVACPVSLPLGTVLQVIEPAEVAGYWTCIDGGAWIVGNRLDFLSDRQLLPWWTVVKARIIQTAK